jgi:hypothetical protein
LPFNEPYSVASASSASIAWISSSRRAGENRRSLGTQSASVIRLEGSPDVRRRRDGTGDLAAQTPPANPHLKSTGFDLAEVAPIFEEYSEANAVTERVSFTPGDFFKHDLPKVDVVLMGHILHDWDLPTKKMLIGKAFDALPKNVGEACGARQGAEVGGTTWVQTHVWRTLAKKRHKRR